MYSKNIMIKRIAYKYLKECVENIGVVLITGPKYCGKSYLAKTLCNSEYCLKEDMNKTIKSFNKDYVLKGEIPRLINNWQYCPKVWDMVRHEVDKSPEGRKVGLYILTGSSSPIGKDQIFHSGAGRIIRMHMYTLTFSEILDLPEEKSISILELFDGKELKTIDNPLTNEQVNEYMFIGGWPKIINEKLSNSKLIIKGYVDALTNMNKTMYYDLRINQQTLNQILHSLARRTTTQIKKAGIINDLNESLNQDTLNKYLEMLYEADVIFDLLPWGSTNIRSSYKMRTTPKTYFCDTSIVSNILGIKSASDFFEDLNTTGILFENQVIKDLMVYAQAIEGKLYFYRDEKGNELDAILELDDGRWAAIEIKLSFDSAVKAATSIDKVISTLKLEGKHKEPSFKMIITNCPRTIKTNNDVYIVPHALLRP